jgi:hypothetical protein
MTFRGSGAGNGRRASWLSDSKGTLLGSFEPNIDQDRGSCAGVVQATRYFNAYASGPHPTPWSGSPARPVFTLYAWPDPAMRVAFTSLPSSHRKTAS